MNGGDSWKKIKQLNIRYFTAEAGDVSLFDKEFDPFHSEH
jgi:hypothetical protein